MIREAEVEDLASLLEIYNDGIMTGTASFEERPLTKEEGVKWFKTYYIRDYRRQ